jgi:hypothetical protein
MKQSFRENKMENITSDILRLAGVPADRINLVHPVPQVQAPCNNSVKYVLVDVIDTYTDHYDKCTAINVKSVYNEIIQQLDELVGCLARHCDEQAIDKFNRLDDKIKRDIMKADCGGVAKAFFKCGSCTDTHGQEEQEHPEPSEEELNDPEDQASASPAVTIIKLKESDEPEECETATCDIPDVTVPADVISDIKLKIKELDDGNNFQYYKHLANADDVQQHYSRVKEALESLLMYLTDANEISVKNAAVYMSSLDSATAHKIPASVWKYLSLTFYNKNYVSIRDRMKEIKI